jgi:C1A family cysteine protease
MKKYLFLIFLCYCTSEYINEFLDYGVQYGKDYHHLSEREIMDRYSAFVANYKNIQKHNSGDRNYKIGYTPFTDIPLLRIKETYLSDFTEYIKPKRITNLHSDTDYEPIDWRDKDIFLTARDQKDCGGCWAFSVTGTIEAHRAIKGEAKSYLSSQQLLDCDVKDKGCKGGWPGIAYEYIQSTGVVEDIYYPYLAETDQCDTSIIDSHPLYKIDSVLSCEEEDCNKDSFIYNLLKNGPVSVVIDAYHSNFVNYKSGYYDEDCGEPNHAIILVGYGYDKDKDIGYWIIRNSWSDKWGIEGYGYVKQNDANNWSCNVTRYGFQPIINLYILHK